MKNQSILTYILGILLFQSIVFNLSAQICVNSDASLNNIARHSTTNNIWMLNRNGSQNSQAVVYELNSTGTTILRTFNNSNFSEALGIVLNPATNQVFVSDRPQNVIRVLNTVTGNWTNFPASPAPQSPGGMLIRNGKLYVIERGTNSTNWIRIYDINTGTQVGIIGNGTDTIINTANIDFNLPHSMLFDNVGNLFVTDTNGSNGRLIILYPNLTLKSVCNISNIGGISMDTHGNIFAMSMTENIRVFRRTNIINNVCCYETLPNTSNIAQFVFGTANNLIATNNGNCLKNISYNLPISNTSLSITANPSIITGSNNSTTLTVIANNIPASVPKSIYINGVGNFQFPPNSNILNVTTKIVATQTFTMSNFTTNSLNCYSPTYDSITVKVIDTVPLTISANSSSINCGVTTTLTVTATNIEAITPKYVKINGNLYDFPANSNVLTIHVAPNITTTYSLSDFSANTSYTYTPTYSSTKVEVTVPKVSFKITANPKTVSCGTSTKLTITVNNLPPSYAALGGYIYINDGSYWLGGGAYFLAPNTNTLTVESFIMTENMTYTVTKFVQGCSPAMLACYDLIYDSTTVKVTKTAAKIKIACDKIISDSINTVKIPLNITDFTPTIANPLTVTLKRIPSGELITNTFIGFPCVVIDNNPTTPNTIYQYSIENVSSLACNLIAKDLCTYSKNGKIIQTNADIKLYPNPSINSIVAISFEDVLAGEKLVDKSEISINISDLLGNSIRSYKVTQNNNIELNLTGLAKGVYTITAQTNGKIYTKKLVLQ